MKEKKKKKKKMPKKNQNLYLIVHKKPRIHFVWLRYSANEIHHPFWQVLYHETVH